MKNMNETPFSLRNRVKSFSYAFQGIKTFFLTQHNAWIHALATVIVIILGNVVKLSTSEWCWIGLAIALVFITEMLNTAIEFLTDIVSPDYHPLAKKTKDVAAGAVLFSAVFSLVIAFLIFIPKVLIN
jgi:diacylglycerol kinase (ATP)